jgi:cyclopropane fatty-acyl-phospholipid synthase-like methyltransferase
VNSEQVRRHFDNQAERFDAIYREEKRLSQKLVDRLFRSVIHRRFQLTFELCGEAAGKRILDIGCGSGRYGVEFARRGAEVVGLDFAPGMIEIAREAARAAGVGHRCRFLNHDFLTWCEPSHFDICLAIGFFDYIEKPGVFLEKIHGLGPEQAVFSFPARWTLRSLPRWIRLRLTHCPVYFYDAKESMQLLADAGWKSVTLHRLSRDYLLHGRLDKN